MCKQNNNMRSSIIKHYLFQLLFTLTFLFSSLFCFAQNTDISISDNLILKLSISNNPNEKIQSLINLSEYYINKDNKKGLAYASEAIDLANEIEDHSLVAEAHLLKSRFFIDKGEFLEASNQIEKAKSNIIIKEDTILVAKTHYVQALLYIHLNELNKAADHSYKALKIYDKISDLDGQSRILNIIAATYSKQGKFDKALEYSLRSLSIKEDLSDSISIAGDLGNIGSGHLHQKNYIQAEKYFQQAIDLNSKYNQKNWLAINYHNMAICYYKQGKNKEAEQFTFQALELNKELNNRLNESSLYILLADNFLLQKNYNKADYYYKLVLPIALEYQFLSELTNTYLGLYQLERKDKDFEKALEYFTLYQSAKDSLYKKESLSKLTSLEIQYIMEQKQNDLELEKQKNIANAQKKNLYMIILSISLLATLVVIILLFLRYRIKIRYSEIKQQKLEDELEFKNKELTTNVMSLMKKNEMLGEITDKLIEVENQAVKDETKSALKKIAIDIENSTKEKIWEEFEMRFKQVHSDFYEKLIQQFPELSPNEQRLCAFLRLNLSTKEIAAITGRNPRSLEMARFRLRKKLGISAKEINLITFISKI